MNNSSVEIPLDAKGDHCQSSSSKERIEVAPADYYLWQDFLDPSMKYECQNCGTLFGDECIARDEGTKCHVATCPGCGAKSVIGDEPDQGRP